MKNNLFFHPKQPLSGCQMGFVGCQQIPFEMTGTHVGMGNRSKRGVEKQKIGEFKNIAYLCII